MSRGLIFMNPMNPLPPDAEFFKFSQRSRFFPRSASCHSRSLSPQYMRRRSIGASLEIPVKLCSCPRKSEIVYERGNIEDFLREGDVMSKLDHPNVLQLLGICYSMDGVPSLVLPFMQLGDLRTYVADIYRQVCVIEVIDFSQQICEGMSYLSSQKIVHRDLAARNCMLNEKYVVKIADFGLAVDLSQHDYHARDSIGSPLRLALKWLPVEVLRNRRNVHPNIDQWSMGVLIWELMTRACPPYDDIQNSDLEWFLNSGKRLPQPLQCPNVLFEIMLSCWRPNPLARPRFSNLAKQLKHIMDCEIEQARRHGRRSGIYFSALPCNNVYTEYYCEQ
ncbi:Protein kinase domain-containing protein [Aphelenchoides bicaudatus]|nr:Protein kinase domain-containing protein [Aphelenchoides bicaudatus]